MVKRPGKLLIGASLLAGSFLMPRCSTASPALPMSFPTAGASPTQTAAPTRNMPWFVLPGRFLFSGGYFVKLSLQEMRIDHMTDNTRCTRRNRTFMISASFAQPIGNELFSSRIELPLLSADRFAVSRLAPASVGDYVMHLSNAPLISSAAELMLTARF